MGSIGNRYWVCLIGVLLASALLHCTKEPDFVGTEAGNAEQVASISGIAFKGGSPVSEATVLYASSDSCSRVSDCAQSAITDTAGFYHLDSLQPGEWVVQVADESDGILSTVEVTQGSVTQMDTVSLLPLGSVSGILSGGVQEFTIRNSFVQPIIDSVHATFTASHMPQGEYQFVDTMGNAIIDVVVESAEPQFMGYLNIDTKETEKVEGYGFCENLILPGYFMPQFIIDLQKGVEDTSIVTENNCIRVNLSATGQYGFDLTQPGGIAIDENWVLNISYRTSGPVSLNLIDIHDREIVIVLPKTGLSDWMDDAFPINGSDGFELNHIKKLYFVSEDDDLVLWVNWFKLSNE
ncbi:MAG: carboxypeptidase-like regulatory domain-containing protein [Fibrobacterales bacterium]